MKKIAIPLLFLTFPFLFNASFAQSPQDRETAKVVVFSERPETIAETKRLVENRPQTNRRVEALDRGLVCVQTPEGVYCSWRLLGTDPDETRFKLYRGDDVVFFDRATNYLDKDGAIDAQYRVEICDGDATVDASKPTKVLVEPYIEIKTRRPDDWTDARAQGGRPLRYQLGNMSTGDLDGDGQYEIIALWESNSRDNAHDGFSAPLHVVAYRLDGTELWDVDCGINIRTGAHYNPFLVFDFDSDGKAEVILKTAPGSKDASGKFVSDASRDEQIRNCDNNADYRNPTGRVLAGPEFLTVFSGLTGEALDTVPYWPERGTNLKKDWGDDYGNRVDRFLACVAFLDGENPSAIFARGYYTRTTLAAYRFENGELTLAATFDSDDPAKPENRAYRGRGNHAVSVADVDYDGKDEIIYGASVFDDDLAGVYPHAPGFPTLFHGDAQHTGDLIPDRPGLEIFSVHESGGSAFDMRDARTGEIIWHMPFQGKDVGRGASDDVDPRFPGAESWAAGKYVTANGEEKQPPRLPVNFFCYWDGDLGREPQDGTSIFKLDPETNRVERIFEAKGCVQYGGSKATPFLNADLFGDWREETVYALADGSGFRIYTTTIPTNYRIPTLMHDPVYRLGVAWQNAGYNQPPHLGYYLGYGVEEIPTPKVFSIDKEGRAKESRNDSPAISIVTQKVRN